MNTQPRQAWSPLRWYPPAWRARYGDELVVLMEDHFGDHPLSPRVKASMVWAGLRERAHASGVLGGGRPPAEQARAGSLLVLCAWTAFVLAGASYSQAAQHFAPAMTMAGRTTAEDAFDVVAGLAVVAAALVVLGAAAALPAFARFIRFGGWSSIRRHVLRAATLTVVTLAATAALSVWAHHLTGVQRNGSDVTYSAGFVGWALLVAATLALWTAAGVAAARRIDLARRVLLFETVLAVGVAGAMVAMTAATAVWWATVAKDAPWFLSPVAPGVSTPPFDLQLALTMALMLGAVLVAAYGVARVARSWTELRAA